MLINSDGNAALNRFYVGWETSDHATTFDLWNKMSKAEFKFCYGSFLENKYLLRQVADGRKTSILDVGCATGTTYRLLSLCKNEAEFEYTGIDLSRTALQKASKLYPAANFIHLKNRRFREVVDRRSDIIFSRDTVMHQTNPYEFIDELIASAERAVVLRLRTRDQGETEFDPQSSCQMHYDQYWMPYIVLNVNELVDRLTSNPRVTEVELNRSYQILGGSNLRYLPKELYTSLAGGAETSLIVHLTPDPARAQDEACEVKNTFTEEGHEFLQNRRLKRFIYSLPRRIFRYAKR